MMQSPRAHAARRPAQSGGPSWLRRRRTAALLVPLALILLGYFFVAPFRSAASPPPASADSPRTLRPSPPGPARGPSPPSRLGSESLQLILLRPLLDHDGVGDIRIGLLVDLSPKTAAYVQRIASLGLEKDERVRFYRAEPVPSPRADAVDNFGGPGPPYALLQGSLPNVNFLPVRLIYIEPLSHFSILYYYVHYILL